MTEIGSVRQVADERRQRGALCGQPPDASISPRGMLIGLLLILNGKAGLPVASDAGGRTSRPLPFDSVVLCVTGLGRLAALAFFLPGPPVNGPAQRCWRLPPLGKQRINAAARNFESAE